MTEPQARPHPGARWLPLGIAVAAACGGLVGFFLRPTSAQAFDGAYAWLSPLGSAAVCAALLHNDAKRARWVVPLLLVLTLASLERRPHVVSLGALALVAGTAAILSAFYQRKRWAIAGVLLCCASVGASLVLAKG